MSVSKTDTQSLIKTNVDLPINNDCIGKTIAWVRKCERGTTAQKVGIFFCKVFTTLILWASIVGIPLFFAFNKEYIRQNIIEEHQAILDNFKKKEIESTEKKDEEIKALKERLAQAGEVNGIAKGDLEVLQKQFDKLLSEKRDAVAAKESLEGHLDAARKTVDEQSTKINEQVVLLDAKDAELNAKDAELKKTIEEAKAKINEIKKQAKQLISEAQAKIEALTKAIANAEEDKVHLDAHYRNEIAKLGETEKAHAGALNSHIGKLKAFIEVLKADIEKIKAAARAKLKDLRTNNAELTKVCEKQAKQIAEAQEDGDEDPNSILAPMRDYLRTIGQDPFDIGGENDGPQYESGPSLGSAVSDALSRAASSLAGPLTRGASNYIVTPMLSAFQSLGTGESDNPENHDPEQVKNVTPLKIALLTGDFIKNVNASDEEVLLGKAKLVTTLRMAGYFEDGQSPSDEEIVQAQKQLDASKKTLSKEKREQLLSTLRSAGFISRVAKPSDEELIKAAAQLDEIRRSLPKPIPRQQSIAEIEALAAKAKQVATLREAGYLQGNQNPTDEEIVQAKREYDEIRKGLQAPLQTNAQEDAASAKPKSSAPVEKTPAVLDTDLPLQSQVSGLAKTLGVRAKIDLRKEKRRMRARSHEATLARKLIAAGLVGRDASRKEMEAAAVKYQLINKLRQAGFIKSERPTDAEIATAKAEYKAAKQIMALGVI